tara:strand:- start:224 stop:1705 length:1482 start_codon:yes stop_codon:yes gene_type:complete
MEKLPPEVEHGNIEYKRQLLNINNDRKIHLASQMKWRLSEGNGKTIYYLGINDDGSIYGLSKKELYLSIKTIVEIVKSLDFKIIKIDKKFLEDKKCFCIITIENKIDNINFRILFLGNTQCGKSTTINVLLNNLKDDGKGFARTSLFNHKHEIIKGKTSSISIRNLGYKNNKLINIYCLSNNDIYKCSDKIVSLIDMPGDIKYYKTIFYNLLNLYPNVIFIIINPFKINYKLLKLYLNYCKIKDIYFIVIFTNQDKKNSNNKIINVINFFKNRKYILNEFIDNIAIDKYYYMNISNLTLYNINKLHILINKISNIKINNNIDAINTNNDEIQIINKYNINELGILLSGICLNGKIKKDNLYYLFSDNTWNKIKINSLQINENIIDSVNKNNLCGINFSILNNIKINKPILITSDIKNYQFTNQLKINILYIDTKLNINNNNNILIFIRNNIFVSKILEYNNNKLLIKINKILINDNDLIIFKINKTYGLATVI